MTPVTTAARASGAAEELRLLLERVLAGEELGPAAAEQALAALTDASTPPVLAGAFLTALRARGEGAGELVGFARGLLARAAGPVPRAPGLLLDTCGTGGDGRGSVNLSSATALLVAALGVPVAKHGNRAVSSRCGSADVLEALGVPFALAPEPAAQALARDGFAFLFAPAFHPCLARLAPVRRELGTRTIFNLLGPLVNPARPSHQLVGAPSPAAARLLAAALSELGVERAFVVHGDGFDEATPCGPFTLVEAAPTGVEERTLDALDFGLERCAPADLAGGDAGENARALERVLAGERGPVRDATCLNAALVLLLVGRAHEPRAAARQAAAALDDGRAAALLARLRTGGRP